MSTSSAPARLMLGKRLLRLLYPTKCMLCGQILPDSEEQLCCDCASQLPRTDEETAIQPGIYFSRCLSPMYYQGALRPSFRRYKFRGQRQYSTLYSQWMIEALKESAADWPVDMVTWIPLNRWRLMRRGYDQTRLLAQPVAEQLHLPLTPTLRKRRVPPQSRLEGSKREANIRDAFQLLGDVDVTGKRILLVDDLITTGSTLEAAAQVLIDHGAADVWSLTLARAK